MGAAGNPANNIPLPILFMAIANEEIRKAIGPPVNIYFFKPYTEFQCFLTFYKFALQ